MTMYDFICTNLKVQEEEEIWQNGFDWIVCISNFNTGKKTVSNPFTYNQDVIFSQSSIALPMGNFGDPLRFP